MRIALLFISITLLSVSGAFAMESKCNFCSDADADYYQDRLSKQDYEIFPLSLINSDNQVFIASDIGPKDDIHTPSVQGDKQGSPLPSISGNIDGLLQLINDTDKIEAFTQDKIDLLSNFRNGDDVVVPLGFFLYLNKKF